MTGGSLNRTSCKLSPAAERELPSCLLASESIICKRPVSMGSGKKLILCERLRDREDCGGDRRNKTSTKRGGRVSFNGGGGVALVRLEHHEQVKQELGGNVRADTNTSSGFLEDVLVNHQNIHSLQRDWQREHGLFRRRPADTVKNSARHQH